MFERIQFRGVVTLGPDEDGKGFQVKSFGCDSIEYAETEMRVIVRRLRDNGLVIGDPGISKQLQIKTGKGEWKNVENL